MWRNPVVVNKFFLVYAQHTRVSCNLDHTVYLELCIIEKSIRLTLALCPLTLGLHPCVLRWNCFCFVYLNAIRCCMWQQPFLGNKNMVFVFSLKVFLIHDDILQDI